jgi:superfamily I DNA/RNA helicase
MGLLAATRKAVLAHVKQPARRPLFEFVLIDEGQDLDGECFELLCAISKHVTVCIDHKQQIYDHGSTEAEILSRLKLRKRNMTLLEAYRCCPYMVRLAAQFISDRTERDEFLLQRKTAQTNIETPLFYEAVDFEDEKRRLYEALKARQRMGERTAILVPLKKQVFGFAKGLNEAGFEVEAQDQPDFRNDKPKVLSYFSAKGLTFDSVLLPRLVSTSFPNMADERIERLLYVALSRARNWAMLSTTIDKELPALARIKALVGKGDITVQRASPFTQRSNVPDSIEESEGSVLDLL